MIKTIFLFLRGLLIFVLLTVVTQVGGLIYLMTKPLGSFIKKKVQGWKGLGLRMILYFSIYMAVSIFIIPKLALKYNRVPLPRFATKGIPLEPARHFYWIANRHYVRQELFNAIVKISNNTNAKSPNRTIHYLDANFPLLKYFPLLPHKSHNDGRRLDIAFLYKNEKAQPISTAPGVLGYGHCEAPLKGEVDYPTKCREQGYRIYSALYHLAKPFRSSHLIFDAKANKQLLLDITKQRSIRKVFIEPHLKTRLQLQAQQKIRFHGCAAVRHDDHIHLEI